MSLFQHDSYRTYLKEHLKSLPKKGHGEISKIAKALGVHSTLISLILSGERELTLEQGYDLSRYLGLTDVETEYFSLLIQFSRAGNHRYKTHLHVRLEQIKKEATQISRRFEHEKSLSEEERALFYSSWLYSAIRLYTSVREKGVTLEEIQSRFPLPRPKLVEIVNFLVSAGLVVPEKQHYKMGPQRTFLEHGSPHLIKHHANWRLKSLQHADRLSEKELMFTAPISIAKADFGRVREELAEFLKRFSQVVKDSPAEEIACLNIDFFWIDE